MGYIKSCHSSVFLRYQFLNQLPIMYHTKKWTYLIESYILLPCQKDNCTRDMKYGSKYKCSIQKSLLIMHYQSSHQPNPGRIPMPWCRHAKGVFIINDFVCFYQGVILLDFMDQVGIVLLLSARWSHICSSSLNFPGFSMSIYGWFRP